MSTKKLNSQIGGMDFLWDYDDTKRRNVTGSVFMVFTKHVLLTLLHVFSLFIVFFIQKFYQTAFIGSGCRWSNAATINKQTTGGVSRAGEKEETEAGHGAAGDRESSRGRGHVRKTDHTTMIRTNEAGHSQQDEEQQSDHAVARWNPRPRSRGHRSLRWSSLDPLTRILQPWLGYLGTAWVRSFNLWYGTYWRAGCRAGRRVWFVLLFFHGTASGFPRTTGATEEELQEVGGQKLPCPGRSWLLRTLQRVTPP